MVREGFVKELSANSLSFLNSQLTSNFETRTSGIFHCQKLQYKLLHLGAAKATNQSAMTPPEVRLAPCPPLRIAQVDVRSMYWSKAICLDTRWWWWVGAAV